MKASRLARICNLIGKKNDTRPGKPWTARDYRRGRRRFRRRAGKR